MEGVDYILSNNVKLHLHSICRKQKETKKKVHGTNIEIWRGCCNQSLESSALRRGIPHAKLDVKLVKFMYRRIPKSEGFSFKIVA